MDVNLRTCEQVYGPCTKVTQATISPDGKFIAVGTATQLLTIHNRHGVRPHPWGVIAELDEQFDEDSTQGFAGLLWHPYVPCTLLVACPNGLIYILSFNDPSYTHDVNLTTRHIINLPEESIPVGGGIFMTHIAMNEEASELTAAIGTRLLTYGDPFEGHYTRADVYRDCIPERLTTLRELPLGIWYVDAAHVAIVYPTSIFVYVPVAPYQRIWTISISQAREIVSATLSLDRSLLVGITQSGQADIYSLNTRCFVSTIGVNQVPLRSLATATFYNGDKVLFSPDDEASLLLATGVAGPTPKLSKFVPYTTFDQFRIMGAGVIDGRYHVVVTRPYIADPTNLNVVGLIVPDNFRATSVTEGSSRQVNINDSPAEPPELVESAELAELAEHAEHAKPAERARNAEHAKPADSADPAQFGFIQALILTHGIGVIFWIVWQFSQLETKSSKDAILAGYCCGFVLSLTWVSMWKG